VALVAIELVEFGVAENLVTPGAIELVLVLVVENLVALGPNEVVVVVENLVPMQMMLVVVVVVFGSLVAIELELVWREKAVLALGLVLVLLGPMEVR